jgi:hypothetical protein
LTGGGLGGRGGLGGLDCSDLTCDCVCAWSRWARRGGALAAECRMQAGAGCRPVAATLKARDGRRDVTTHRRDVTMHRRDVTTHRRDVTTPAPHVTTPVVHVVRASVREDGWGTWRSDSAVRRLPRLSCSWRRRSSSRSSCRPSEWVRAG